MSIKTKITFFLAAFLLVAGLGYLLTLDENLQERGSETDSQVAKTVPAGRTFVIWLSIDGIHVSDLLKTETPFFDRLKNEAKFSLEHRVVFPSVTFASHVSQATGVKPGVHGIVANRFYDHETGRIYSYPGQASLLNAEPIWNTAQRQGLRVAVSDWTLSHQQEGPYATSYFDQAYERGLRDRERLWQIIDIWKEDPSPETLRLLMGYAVGPDSPGHAYGPGSPEVLAAVRRIDGILQDFFETAVKFFDSFREKDDRFILVITSDHGMSPVHTLVHPGILTGIEDEDAVVAVHSANLLHLYFIDQDKIDMLTAKVVESVEKNNFASVYTRAEAHEKWNYGHPTRTGDLVVVLDTGYTFSRRARRATQDVKEIGGPVGMHGYDPAFNSDMNTVAFFVQYPSSRESMNLGPIDSLQLHPTIARLLNIDPSSQASAEPLILFCQDSAK